MASDPPLEALVFDAYGTIFDVYSIAALCEQIFPGRGSALTQLWRGKQLEYTWLRSLMERHEDFAHITEAALRYACAASGLDCSASDRATLMQAYLTLAPYPDAILALPRLQRFPLAILSNGTPRMLEAVLQNAGLAETFSHVISVEEVGVFKPSPRVYALAPARLGVDKSKIALISSNAWDIAGAAAFGMQTFWVQRSGLPMDELGVVALKSARNLLELVDELLHTRSRA
jgi:2-haloacid dehalogenase